MNLIAAVDKNWAIGRRGQLLVSIPGDQQLFRQETVGKVIVMGRKTLESLPGGQPLAGRTNVVLTRDPGFQKKGCEIFHSLGEALEYLKQFAVMGSIYMNKILGIDSPRVGIANIGTEETKGTELQKETYALLKETDLNFIGNTEVRDIPFGAADVIVSDGFTGNVILKMYEGTAKFFSGSIKSILKRSPVSLFGALFVKSGFEDLKKKMDYKEFGGAPLMGLAKPVIKAHGSSDARAFKNAVRQAVSFAEMKVAETIAENIKDNEEDSED